MAYCGPSTSVVEMLTRLQVRHQLAAHHGLREKNDNKGKRPPGVIRIEELFELLRTLWTTDQIHFKNERERVQLALLLQLAAYSGNRPSALLELRYRDIEVALHPNEHDDDSAVVITIHWAETKSYQGKKKT